MAATAALGRGGIVLYPTDTLYGLGADSLNKEALEKILAIKGRDAGKPIHSIVSSLEAAKPYAEVTPLAEALAKRFLPGPLTILLAKKDAVPDWAVSGRSTFGIRVPKHELCLAIAHAFGKPYTATSANKSGVSPERSVDAIISQLEAEAQLIDLIIDAGELPEREPSSVVDASGDEPLIVREGAISARDITAR